MRLSIRRLRPARSCVAGILVAVVLAGCAGPVKPTPSARPVASATAAGSASPVVTQPAPTAVPGGATVAPDPVPTGIPATQTDWGEILDAVPASFPVYPGARVADGVEGPVSQALIVPGTDEGVAGWYRDALTGEGYAVELSDPLEDGSRVLDAASDLPECRIQIDFRPARESTMITVLFASACAGLGG